MTLTHLTTHAYTSRNSAMRAMWTYVRQLQRDGVHTGALMGDGGMSAQWITNDGRTFRATVDPDGGYRVAGCKWRVCL